MKLRAAMAALTLCVTSTTVPVATTHEDPDIGWALRLENEQTALVLDTVNRYFDDPDAWTPVCWEDEAVVVIIDHAHPQYGDTVPPRVGEAGCVPLDDLPVQGFRP